MERKATQKKLDDARLELRKLEDGWSFHNNPFTNKDLKESLFTRLNEQKSEVQRLERELTRPEKKKRHRRTREELARAREIEAQIRRDKDNGLIPRRIRRKSTPETSA